MTHLTDGQLVDAADETLGATPSAHVAHCPLCAEKVEALRHTLAAVRTDEVPDPSPEFWAGFAARVGSAIDAPADRQRAWVLPPWRWALTAAALAIVVLGLQFAASRTTPQDAAATVARPNVASDAPGSDPDDSSADEAWSIVESVAADWHFDDAHDAGVMPRPGAIERVATELSPEERAELIRLIEDELKRTGA